MNVYFIKQICKSDKFTLYFIKSLIYYYVYLQNKYLRLFLYSLYFILKCNNDFNIISQFCIQCNSVYYNLFSCDDNNLLCLYDSGTN